MTIKISRPQADTFRAIKRGLNTCPPLQHAVVEVLVRKSYLREISIDGKKHYEITEEGSRFC